MVLYLTGLGVVFFCLLWILVGIWEWSVPKGLEKKIINWKKKKYHSQGILHFETEKPITEQEHFIYSLKQLMPKLERELGLPVHVEIELNHQDTSFSDEEIRYISCVTRAFSEFTWRINKRPCREGD